MDENKFSSQVLDKIECCKLCPKSKWHFKSKNYITWGLAGLSLLLASLALTLVIYFFDYSNLPLLRSLSKSYIHFLMLAMPYSWLLLLLGAILLSYSQIKHTEYGYRYSLLKVALLSLLTSLVLGTVLYFAGIGKLMDDILISRSPYYSTVINPRAGFWFNPEEGRLMGIVTGINPEKNLILVDINHQEWLVDTIKLENHPPLPLGMPIKIVGEKIETNIFLAHKILAPGPEEGFIRRHKMMEERETPLRINMQVPTDN